MDSEATGGGIEAGNGSFGGGVDGAETGKLIGGCDGVF